MEPRTYTIIIEPTEASGFWAYVPALPGCFTQGASLEEVVVMAKQAIEGFLEVLAEHGEPLPVEAHHSRRQALDIQVMAPAPA